MKTKIIIPGRALKECRYVLEAVNAITHFGTRIWLFDAPPTEAQQETTEVALEVNDAGIPVSKRTIVGVLGKKAKAIEKDRGFGTYKVWDEDHNDYNIKAVTKEQHALKQITLSAITTKDVKTFWRKCKNILNPLVDYRFNYEYPEDAKSIMMKKFDQTLTDIRDTIHGELLEAALNPELNGKARLYWDILKASNPEAFGNIRTKVEVDAKVADTTPKLELPAIVAPEGWNV